MDDLDSEAMRAVRELELASPGPAGPEPDPMPAIKAVTDGHYGWVTPRHRGKLTMPSKHRKATHSTKERG